MSKQETTLFYLPKNTRQMGQADEKIGIYIEDYVMSYIKYMGKNSMEQEKIAILLGENAVWDKKPVVCITGALCVEREEVAEECFAKETWERIYREIEKNFKKTEIVGWMYAKAGMGFEVDERIQKIYKANFMGEQKVLFLYDALEQNGIFYGWDKGTIKPLSGYTIFYEKNQKMQEYLLKQKGEVEKEKVDGSVVAHMRKNLGKMEERKKQAKKVKKRIKIAFLFVGIVLAYTLISQQQNIQKTINVFSFAKQAKEQESQAGKIVELAGNAGENEKAETQKKKKREKQETETQERQDVLEPIQENAGEQKGEEQYYTIQPGDTLVHICMEKFQSLEKMEQIMRLNGITDKNRIVAGQQIKLWE